MISTRITVSQKRDYNVIFIVLPAIEYERLIHKEFCSNKTLIKSEEQCKLAAAELDIPWGGRFCGHSGNFKKDIFIAGCFTWGLRGRYWVMDYRDVLTGSFQARYCPYNAYNASNINIDIRAICGKIEGRKMENISSNYSPN